MIQTSYRDSKTGRFASKETWKRSKAQGGSRYKRERIEHKPKEKPEPEPPGEPPEDFFDTWIIGFDY